MKKQLILAALSAALVATPFLEAVAKPSSGGSSSRSSSGFSSVKTSKSSSGFSSAPSRASSSSWAPSSTGTKRDTGSGWGSSSPTYPKRDYAQARPAPASATYAPANQVTPQPKPVSGGAAYASTGKPVAGFSDTNSSAKKKVAAVAGASAVGGALYAAGANQDAVAAYESSQAAASVSPSTGQPTPATGSATTRIASGAPASNTDYLRNKPQVIVVKDAPRYRDNDSDDAYWYHLGRESAARDARVENPFGMQDGYTQPQAQSKTSSQVVQPARVPAKAATSIADIIVWGFVIVMVLGALAFFAHQVMTSPMFRDSPSPSPAPRKANYTL